MAKKKSGKRGRPEKKAASATTGGGGGKKGKQSPTKKAARGRKAPIKKSTSKKQAKQDKNPASGKRQNGFPIVGVGASAGGLDALRRLLEPVPDESGVAFVIIQHLDPTKKSLAPELLGKYTKMQVAQIDDDPRVKPNCVYVIPPDKYLSIAGGELHLSEPDKPRGARMAIDFFLRSLAKDQRQCAVGVILSGTGTDGSLGIKAIKAGGGLVIAQDPTSAEFDGMPRSAIDTSVVDHILPAEKISDVLVRYAEHPYVCESPAATPSEGEVDAVAEPITDGFNSVIALLRTHTKHDFRNYKDKTLVRRTRRRMCLHHIDDYDKYLEYLRSHPNEIDALAKDLLITVTDFFREPDAWERLRRVAIQPLVAEKPSDDPIRVWTPGCATGEEPYSVAMLLLEEVKTAEKNCPLQIFASDIDQHAIDYGRVGRYPRSIEADVSAERLSRFFTAEDVDDYYYVNKTLREAVVFADQNLIADPPFSKLDLVCCRNLLIYLKPDVQEKVIALFHFALRESGILMLGSAETIGRQIDLFQSLDKRWRIFRRIGATHHDRVDIPLTTQGPRREIDPALAMPKRREVRVTHLAQQRLLDMLAPNAVLIDRNWRVLYICGDVDNYLTYKSGAPTDNLLEIARRGLRTKLRGTVHTALAEGRTVSAQARVQSPAGNAPVTLTVRVIKDREQEEELALILFDSEPAAGSKRNRKQAKPAARKSTTSDSQRALEETDFDDDAVVHQLEEELAETRDDLQATIEQLETSGEEFKASNEEVMSVNEELQSTNEELETSKEELQSLNEELSTVNNQLASKVEELETKHADLENLLAVTDVPTICLDTDLTVRWFTPAAQNVVRLKPADCGRPLADFAHDFSDGGLVEVVRQVLDRLTPVEDEVTCRDERTFLRRVHPYRTDDHRIGGVVVTFVDISARKRSEDELRESEQRFRLLFDMSPSFLWEEDWSAVRRYLDDLKASGVTNVLGYFKNRPDAVAEQLRSVRLTAANRASLRLFDAPDEATVLENLEQLIAEDSFDVIAGLLAVLADGKTSYSDEVYVVTLNGQRRCVIFYFQVEPGCEDTLERVIVSLADVTDRKRAEQELRLLNESLEQQVEQRTDMLKLLQDITRSANESRTVVKAMRTAMEHISEFNGWQVGHVWRPDDDSRDMVSSGIWFVSDDANEAVRQLDQFQQICAQTHFSPGQFLIGAVAESGETRWIDDIANSADWRRGDAVKLGLRAAIAFPVTVNGEIVAVLEFFSDHPAKRDRRFMEILPDVGIQLGHVIERKRLEKLVADATEAEQRRIGSDIHDGLGQELAGLRYMAQTHAETLAEQPSPEVKTAQRIAKWLETIQRQLRDIIRELVPVARRRPSWTCRANDESSSSCLQCGMHPIDSCCRYDACHPHISYRPGSRAKFGTACAGQPDSDSTDKRSRRPEAASRRRRRWHQADGRSKNWLWAAFDGLSRQSDRSPVRLPTQRRRRHTCHLHGCARWVKQALKANGRWRLSEPGKDRNMTVKDKLRVANETARVMIVDDHPALCEGLGHRISAQRDLSVCGQAGDVDSALKMIREMHPDVVIVDIALKNSDGLELIKAIKSRHKRIRTLAHSMYDESLYADRCLHAGAMGYVNKGANSDEVILAIREILAGRVYLSSAMTSTILARTISRGQPKTDPIDTLTDRQVEVFRLLGDGQSAQQIAKRLHISVHTVETHRENIKRKLNVNTVSDLIRRAVLWAAENT